VAVAVAIDLFAGLGGWTLGASWAGVRVLWAANHSPDAVRYHALNHPDTAHVCQDLRQADWRQAPRADILLASPCCQGHTHARGKDLPHHDASRSTAWAVVDALDCLRCEVAVVENVPEFTRWVLYPVWEQALRTLGYSLTPLVLDAADAGVPQNRVRLFVVATRSRHAVPLHLAPAGQEPARSIIEWERHPWSPVHRPGRSARTLARIERARRDLGTRFVMPYYGSGSGLTGRSIDRPLGTLTTRARWGVVDGDRMRMLAPSEALRAMSFPTDYRIPADLASANRMIGNAVCPLQAKAVLASVLEAA